MEYRSLNDSSLKLSAITFGAWAAGGWMWGKTDRNDAIEAIRVSYDEGVTSIDTAPIYGQGDSELIVGEAIKGIPREKVQLLTKFGMRWDLVKGNLAFKSKNNQGDEIDIYKYAGRESIIEECDNSLKRLGTDYIDLYQIHWPDITTPIDETMEAVAELMKQGKVRFVGVCNYNAAQMQEAANTVHLVSNQVPYSMVNRGIETETLPYCIKHNKSILAYSPIERGLLSGKMAPGHQFAAGDHRANNKFFTDESIARTNVFLQKIKPLADSKNATLAQLVIKWTLERSGISIALVGARNKEQALQNAKAINLPLTQHEIDFINEQLQTL